MGTGLGSLVSEHFLIYRLAAGRSELTPRVRAHDERQERRGDAAARSEAECHGWGEETKEGGEQAEEEEG